MSNQYSNPHIRVTDLEVVAPGPTGEFVIVDKVNFSIAKGEVLALIGESGSGKTTIALTLMGYARGGCRISGGCVMVGDTEVTALNLEDLEALRGSRVAYVAQSAAAAFNPSKTIMDQVTEVAAIHGLMSRPEAEEKAVELFHALSLPEPESLGSRFPHQVSGGQLQRLMAAMALMSDPELVIFDEPTTALDVTTQIDVLKAFKRVVVERNITAVYVSHDLAVVAQMADQVVVLNKGQIRECGATEQVLTAPQHDYTKTLMAAAKHPQREGLSKSEAVKPLLQVNGLMAGYGKINRQGMPAIPILRDVDFSLERGATLGVIGESGSGKSTLARVIAGLLPPADGDIRFDDEPLPKDLAQRNKEHFRRIQIVFQNADTALNPSHTIESILGRPLTFYHGLKGLDRKKRVEELLALVKLPTSLINRRCSDLSGGQKQRINLARALAAEPDLILCDEVTSALDTVVGAAILELLAELRRELNLAIIFISHDISTVRSICDDILVLYGGQRVEYGNRASFVTKPFHPYTDMLIASVPELRLGWLEDTVDHSDQGTIEVLEDNPRICRFLDRCPKRVEGLCNVEIPVKQKLSDDSEILCHLTESQLLVELPASTVSISKGVL